MFAVSIILGRQTGDQSKFSHFMFPEALKRDDQLKNGVVILFAITQRNLYTSHIGYVKTLKGDKTKMLSSKTFWQT